MLNEHNIFGVPKTYFFCTPGLVLSFSKHIFIIVFRSLRAQPQVDTSLSNSVSPILGVIQGTAGF